MISTGGGAVVDPVNMAHLRRDSTVVLLTADLDTIEQRIARSPRPPLTNLPLREEIAEMLDRRRQNYHASADLCIDTSGTTPATAAVIINDRISKGVPTPSARKDGLAFFRGGRLAAPALRRLEDPCRARRQIPSPASSALPGIPRSTAGAPGSSMPSLRIRPQLPLHLLRGP